MQYANCNGADIGNIQSNVNILFEVLKNIVQVTFK